MNGGSEVGCSGSSSQYLPSVIGLRFPWKTHSGERQPGLITSSCASNTPGVTTVTLRSVEQLHAKHPWDLLDGIFQSCEGTISDNVHYGRQIYVKKTLCDCPLVGFFLNRSRTKYKCKTHLSCGIKKVVVHCRLVIL